MEGTSESDCKTSLRIWASNDKSKYSYLDYSRFPNIDSVAKVCKSIGEAVVAYIQITVGETHKLDGIWMDELDEIFKVRHKERIFIVIQPWNVDSHQKIRLIGGHLPKNVLLFEAYFEG